jgi:hypothetical protein
MQDATADLLGEIGRGGKHPSAAAETEMRCFRANGGWGLGAEHVEVGV